MKVLVKTKSENVVLVIPGTRNYVDYFRHRVYDNVSDMDRWESRGLIERIFLKEDAKDDVFLSLFKKDPSTAVSNFLKRYSTKVKNDGKVEEKVEAEVEGEVEGEVEESEEVEPQKPQPKTNAKSYKRR